MKNFSDHELSFQEKITTMFPKIGAVALVAGTALMIEDVSNLPEDGTTSTMNVTPTTEELRNYYQLVHISRLEGHNEYGHREESPVSQFDGGNYPANTAEIVTASVKTVLEDAKCIATAEVISLIVENNHSSQEKSNICAYAVDGLQSCNFPASYPFPIYNSHWSITQEARYKACEALAEFVLFDETNGCKDPGPELGIRDEWPGAWTNGRTEGAGGNSGDSWKNGSEGSSGIENGMNDVRSENNNNSVRTYQLIDLSFVETPQLYCRHVSRWRSNF